MLTLLRTAGRQISLVLLAGLICLPGVAWAKEPDTMTTPLQQNAIAIFSTDITPPIGHPLCAGWYPSVKGITNRLMARGIVLFGAEKPVVLCALDWAEVSNREHLRWRQALAAAVGTDPDRVSVQCTHAHNTPWPDREAQDLLDNAGYPNLVMLGQFCEQARDAVAAAAKAALAQAQPVTHLAVGQAKVVQVASNRRVMGDDGRVKAVRWTKTRDAAVRAEPEGLIDPYLKTISFWNGEKKLAVLHYYAVHPTSFDGDGLVTPDFVGLARDKRMAEDGVPRLYFTGCAGNITAGKYNDGNPANRPVLTGHIYDAMVASETDMRKVALGRWHWQVEPVTLPALDNGREAELTAQLRLPDISNQQRSRTAMVLAYLHRQDLPIPVTCLYLAPDICILHLPGEAFIEYQLDAQAHRPGSFVAVASYGDLGPGYITLERSFREGGYEPSDSFVSGQSEAIMREAIWKLMQLRL